MGQSFEICELQRPALVGGKLADGGAADGLPLFSGGGGLDVVGAGWPLRDLFEASNLRTRRRTPGTQTVDRAAPRRDQEPGENLAAPRIEGRRRAPGEEEDLLEDFFGLAAVTEDPPREAEQPSRVAVVELGESRRVVFASVADAAGVGYRPCEVCRPRDDAA